MGQAAGCAAAAVTWLAAVAVVACARASAAPSWPADSAQRMLRVSSSPTAGATARSSAGTSGSPSGSRVQRGIVPIAVTTRP